MDTNEALYRSGRTALAAFCRHVSQRGAYRVIRDPEGAISIWDILGKENGPFEISFADRGRVSRDLGKMPPEFVTGLIRYLAGESGAKTRVITSR